MRGPDAVGAHWLEVQRKGTAACTIADTEVLVKFAWLLQAQDKMEALQFVQTVVNRAVTIQTATKGKAKSGRRSRPY